MPQDDAQFRREETIRAVRQYLADRQAVSQRAQTITHNLSIEFDFTEREVEAALAYLVGNGHVSKNSADLGFTPHYQITGIGLTAANS